MKLNILLLLFCLCGISATAQELAQSPLKSSYIIYTDIGEENLNVQLAAYSLPSAEPIFAEAGLYRISLKKKKQDMLKAIKHNPDIRIYPDRPVDLRRVPDDPGVGQMWSIKTMHLDKAWNFDMDGVTSNGDTIVLAVIDRGMQVNHEDLASNIWINKAEIPQNNIDDDNNGYIDDYNSYNFRQDTSFLNPDNTHGTPVAGIMGAVGNNQKGGTGIMWSTKLMNLGPAYIASDIIEAMQYIYNRRKAYNESQGASGDFIVAVNCSWGWEPALPSDLPGICNVFNMLNNVGVLVVCAVTNSYKNVEENGDMPSACPQPNVISVTNIDREELIQGGYGDKYVDIAAPGSDNYTCSYDNSYRGFSGTSCATPHITGSIGYLYDIACANNLRNLFTDPAAVAQKMRKIILDNARAIPDAAEKVSSGGVVDLYASAIALQKACGLAKVGPIAINSIYPNPVIHQSFLNIEITHPDFQVYKFEVFNVAGELVDEVNFEANPMSSTYQLDITGYQSGVYFIRFYHCPGNGNIPCGLDNSSGIGAYLKSTDVVTAKFVVLK